MGLLLILYIGLVSSSVFSLPTKTYNQRQEGELNIHAQLDNIVIVLIPTSGIGNLVDLSAFKQTRPFKQAGIISVFGKTSGTPSKIDIDKTAVAHDKVRVDASDKNDIPSPSLLSDAKNNNNIQPELIAPILQPVLTISQPVVLNHMSDIKEVDGKTPDLSVDDQSMKKDDVVVAKVEEMKPSDIPVKKITELSPPKKVPSVLDSTAKPFDKQKNEITSVESDQKPVEVITKNVTLTLLDLLRPTTPSESSSTSQKNVQDFPAAAEKEVVKPLVTKIEPDFKDSTFERDTPIPVENKQPKESDIALRSSDVTELPKTSSTHEESEKPVETTRKDKVIKYEPQSKWAPGLVSLIGPPRAKVEAERRAKAESEFRAHMCIPGFWDDDLGTCIFPDETRTRDELRSFLATMRFGKWFQTPQNTTSSLTSSDKTAPEKATPNVQTT